MCLIGACVSPHPADRECALQWLDFVEEWTFSPNILRDETWPSDPRDVNNIDLQQRLHALQAAYCTILLQTWEGTPEAKRRARRSRYTDIIGAFRGVCTRSITHGSLNHYLEHADAEAAWRTFVIKEELIRTLTYIVLLDTAYVIFNNTPSRMALQEARLQLSCPDACFQAEDAATWKAAMSLWANSEIGRRQPTMSQVNCIMWNKVMLDGDLIMLHQMSLLNMFIMIHRKSH
jgi:hypothetical protein